MKLRIAHDGDKDIIVQSSAHGHLRLHPRTIWERLFSQTYELTIGPQELIVIRTDGMVEPETRAPIKTPV